MSWLHQNWNDLRIILPFSLILWGIVGAILVGPALLIYVLVWLLIASPFFISYYRSLNLKPDRIAPDPGPILNYVKEVGCFIPPQYKGGYDNIPFTHEEYHEYIKYLEGELKGQGVEYNDDGIFVRTVHFLHNGDPFVFRHLEMGEYIDQLMTLDVYKSNFEEMDKAGAECANP